MSQVDEKLIACRSTLISIVHKKLNKSRKEFIVVQRAPDGFLEEIFIEHMIRKHHIFVLYNMIIDAVHVVLFWRTTSILQLKKLAETVNSVPCPTFCLCEVHSWQFLVTDLKFVHSTMDIGMHVCIYINIFI